MAEFMSVTVGELDRVSQAMTSAVRDVRGELDQLDRRAVTLAAQWTGEAQQAYRTAHDTWTEAMADLAVIAEAAAAAIARADARYQEAERANVERWSLG